MVVALVGTADARLAPPAEPIAVASGSRRSYLVNMARSSAIDEPRLIDALQAGAIAGAGLDVFEREPLPADSRSGGCRTC